MKPRLAPLVQEPTESISALIATLVYCFESRRPVDEFEAPTKVERPVADE